MKNFAFLLLALLILDMLLIDHVTAWRRRRRRRCNKSRPAGVNWANNWDGRVHFDCDIGKGAYHFTGHDDFLV